MNVAEIFSSIHGEINGQHQGRVVTFIRLSGCNLNCSYCDTEETQSFDYGKSMYIPEILNEVLKQKNKCVCITGGEPLFHPDIERLLYALWESDYSISIETNGTINITPFFRYVDSFVVDFKLDFIKQMLHTNFIRLRKTDIIKFIIASTKQLTQAIFWKNEFESIGTQAIFAFSPLYGIMPPDKLANILIGQHINNSVLSLQIHKLLKLK